MQGRNRRITISFFIIGVLIIGFLVYLNGKYTGIEDGEVVDASIEQKDEQPSIFPDAGETVQSVSTQETTEPTVTPTPTKHVYRITNPPTEAPTPIPPTATPNPWKETEYPPTCEEAGYIVRENSVEGYTVIDEGKSPLGHEYGEWKQDAETEMYITTCTRCGKEIKQRVPYEGTIPRIDLTGSMEGISKSDRVTLQFEFASPLESFSCFAYTSWQGHSTLRFPKKNYTIRLYDDETITDKHRLMFNRWQREHKYVLKANYRDTSQGRNLIAADIWADMAAIRSDLFDTLRLTSNYGAVDGFPVIVYLNRVFHGMYTMNLHIDNDLFQMDNAYDAVMIANSAEPEECRFYAEAAFTDQKNAWEVEFCGTGDDNQWARDRLNELIRFVMTADNDTFREHLGEYIDVPGAIDYLIFLYVTGLQNNASKDLVLLKYHDCDVWIPSVYDMEGAFGLNLDTLSFISPEAFLPAKDDGIRISSTENLLWDRLLQLFDAEIRVRYTELRKTILTEDGIKNRIDKYIEGIPKEYYEKDLLVWPRKLPDGEPADQMKTYIELRLKALDEHFFENESIDSVNE